MAQLIYPPLECPNCEELGKMVCDNRIIPRMFSRVQVANIPTSVIYWTHSIIGPFGIFISENDE